MDKRGLFIAVFLVFSLIAASALAAVCPDVTPLSSITGLTDPSSIAIDSKGNLYVTEGVKDTIKIFNQSGRLTGSIAHRKPFGIAVDSGGLYVSSLKGTLTIYGTDLKVKKVVNTGIRYGSAVAVSAERIYVSDPKWGGIRVYDKEGGYLFNIKADSNFSPVWLVVEPSTSNIYAVTKAPAGVYVFSQSGSLIRKFSSDAVETGGLMVSPRGILLDSSNRVYISDALGFQTFVVFDTSNNYVCSFGAGVAMNKPFGIAMGGNKILYVLDKEGRKIVSMGIDDFVKMELSPSSLSFKAYGCGQGTPSQKITIANKGKGVLNWTLSPDSTWITVSQAKGQIPAASSGDIEVSVNADGMSVGTHKGSITVSSQGASESILVSVEILPPPVLSVSPTSLSFLVKGSNIPPAETVNIELKEDVSNLLEWTASSDSTWLKVSPSKGPSNTLSMVNVRVDVAGLNGGQYTGNVKVDANCAKGSPSMVKIDMTYIKGGTIKVITNLDEATYTITGPETYSGTGKYFIREAVPEGVYTVTFGRIKGFKTPSTQSQLISDGQVREFSGNYKDLRKSVKIVATMGKVPQSLTEEVRIFERQGTLISSFPISSKTGNRFSSETASGDIDGDGRDDIIVASIKATDGVITGYMPDGSQIAGLKAGIFKGMNAEVAVGDVDGSGIKEIIVGGAPYEGNSPQVRVLSFKNSQVGDTGVNFLAYEGSSGVNVAGGDIDGDGMAEILTVAGGRGKTVIEVRIWKIDVSRGDGNWMPVPYTTFNAGVSFGSTDIGAGDLDGDGTDEIIVTLVPDSSSKTATITAYRKDGSQVMSFDVEAPSGVVISAGDTDFDGTSEIVVGDSGTSQAPSRIRVYDAGGSLLSEFTAFDNKSVSGVKISLGEVGY